MSLTPQLIFNTVATHLLKQGKRSEYIDMSDGSVSCAYRGAGGLKCAVGVLIPDECYDAAMEGTPVRHLLVRFRIHGLPCDPPSINFYLLNALQIVHDAHNPIDWRSELRRVAHSYLLSDAVLDEVSA